MKQYMMTLANILGLRHWAEKVLGSLEKRKRGPGHALPHRDSARRSSLTLALEPGRPLQLHLVVLMVASLCTTWGALPVCKISRVDLP